MVLFISPFYAKETVISYTAFENHSYTLMKD